MLRILCAVSRSFSADAMSTTGTAGLSSAPSTTTSLSVAVDPGKDERRRRCYEQLLANAPKPAKTPRQIIPRATDVILSNRRPTDWHKRVTPEAASTKSMSTSTGQPASQRSSRTKRCTRIAPRQGPTITEFFQRQINGGAPHCTKPGASCVLAPIPRPAANVMDSGSQQRGGRI